VQPCMNMATSSVPKNVWVGNDLAKISSGFCLDSVALCLDSCVCKMEIPPIVKESMKLYSKNYYRKIHRMVPGSY
jgi:hypothetical protein